MVMTILLTVVCSDRRMLPHTKKRCPKDSACFLTHLPVLPAGIGTLHAMCRLPGIIGPVPPPLLIRVNMQLYGIYCYRGLRLPRTGTVIGAPLKASRSERLTV